MEIQIDNAAEEPHAIEVHHKRLEDMISGGSQDFDAWNSLIPEIEKTYHDDINSISLAFDFFLSKFPLCHWNWKRYAYHKARLCNAETAVEIFERAVESTPFSVGLWVDYCTFALSSFEDPFDVRRLFTKGISLVGKDYFCHVLWDKYMSYECSQKNWGFLALVYVQILRFPTKKLHTYYENFKKLVTNLEEEILHLNDGSHELQLEELSDGTAVLSDRQISQVIKDLQDPFDESVRLKALCKYKYSGEQLYQKACQLEEKIKNFESNIRRRYFHATPLDNDDLKNWHDYLDFIEKQEDFDWALKLYERCLISCANYPEFWMRYVDFMETKGGRELAIFALERATKVFSKNAPEIHLFTARYMEQIGDPDGARASFPPVDTDWDSYFIEYVINQANMEKRLGNSTAACDIYERALKIAIEEQKWQCLPTLYVHFYRFKHMITDSVEAARDVIIDGILCIPGCRLLYEELIKFAMVHDGARQLSIIDSVIANAISPVSEVSQGLDMKDREIISILFLEFVDLCGSIFDIRKAWNRHIKLFPQFIRTNTSSKYPGTGKCSFKSFTEQRKSISYVLVNQPSKVPTFNHLIQLSKEEQAHLLPIKDGKQSHQLSAEPSSALDTDKDAISKPEQLSPKATGPSSGDDTGKNELSLDLVDQSKNNLSTPMEISHDMDAAGKPDQLSPNKIDPSSGDGSGKNELSLVLVEQSKNDLSMPMELSHDLLQQTREDMPGPMDFSYDSIPQSGEDKSPGPVLESKEVSRPLLVLEVSQEQPSPENIHRDSHQSGEDASKSPGTFLECKEPSRPLSVLEASQEQPSLENIHQEQDVEVEQHLKPVSLETFSTVIDGKGSQGFDAMHSDDLEMGQEIPLSSIRRSQDPVNNGDGPASLSSSETHQYPPPAEMHTDPVAAENLQQTNDIVTGPGSGSLKDPKQSAEHDQQKQPQQAVSQEPHLLDSQGHPQTSQIWEMATDQCETNTALENIPTNHSWRLNKMEQISMSGSHPQVSSSSIPQHSMSGNQQIGSTPHHKALNQISQNISVTGNHPQVSSPASYSQQSTPQHSGQNSQQMGSTHHHETLNQTSQHHYKQQHLLHQQYQQQQLLMQPYSNLQQQQLQPHPSQQMYQQQQQLIQPHQQQQDQQQMLLLQQQQYIQQLQSLPYPLQQFQQHQLQYLPQAHQQWQQLAQQMQPQEAQQTQQHYLQAQEQQLQQYRQAQELAYQMQQHGYQLLLHQYQAHQQGYQNTQQQQQWQQQGHLHQQQYLHPQQQQYHHLDQQQDEQHEQAYQGQQVAVQHSSSTPAPESESPEVAKQPESAEGSRYSASPYRRPLAHGISPSHGTGTLPSDASSFSRKQSSQG